MATTTAAARSQNFGNIAYSSDNSFLDAKHEFTEQDILDAQVRNLKDGTVTAKERKSIADMRELNSARASFIEQRGAFWEAAKPGDKTRSQVAGGIGLLAGGAIGATVGVMSRSMVLTLGTTAAGCLLGVSLLSSAFGVDPGGPKNEAWDEASTHTVPELDLLLERQKELLKDENREALVEMYKSDSSE